MKNNPTTAEVTNNVGIIQEDYQFLTNLGFKDEDIERLKSFGNIDFPLSEDDKDMITMAFNKHALDIGGYSEPINPSTIGLEDKKIIVKLVLVEIDPNYHGLDLSGGKIKPKKRNNKRTKKRARRNNKHKVTNKRTNKRTNKHTNKYK